MPTAENAIIKYESGQSLVSMAELSDAGDKTTFNSPDEIWSNRSGYAPDVKPNGLVSGGVITPAASGTDNLIDISEAKAYIGGVLTTIPADTDVACTRATPTDTHLNNSVTITSAGAFAVVAGTGHTEFSDTRDADGGPPLIPVGSIEIGQVKLGSNADAVIAATEIFQVLGTHQERWDYPTWNVNLVSVQNQVMGLAGVSFHSALPAIHTGAVPKKVFAEYYEPIFAQVPISSDFSPPENAHSISSKQAYGVTLGAKSTSLGQGTFTAYLNDGITDGLVKLKNERLWFKFKQNRLADPYILCNGDLGIVRSFPSGDSISAACTISAEKISYDVAT